MSFLFPRARHGAVSRELTRVLDTVKALEPDYRNLTDDQLRGRSADDLAVRLAVAGEAAARTLGQRPYDTQILAAAAMATGRVIEMLTGEGKTLAAALAACVVATDGPIHIATANDYLAGRDANWMRPLYEYMGKTVAVIAPEASRTAKQQAYRCDIVYSTARELAFDYLRDTLTAEPANRVQRGHGYALVDEIDFVLLDEARIPFVVTRTMPADPDGLVEAARIVGSLDAESDLIVDDAQRTVWLTDAGIDRVEDIIGRGAVGDPHSYAAAKVQMALRARGSVRRDRDYVVADGRVHIVDEFTGRILPGRRWTDGLHQAVEAKEGVAIRNDSRPLAQITVRSYFDRYETLVGMSGTAQAAYREFLDTYGVDVLSIPPHLPVIREDLADRTYATLEDKYTAVVDEVTRRHGTGQPILIGTTTVAHSEYLSFLLSGRDISHQVLNAKHHAEEALIVAEAGRVGAVTVATNMAGRGVDIKLGGSNGQDGHETVLRLGGLCVIGTERHTSRRVDDQLRGRAGRQGDPGTSVFFVSLQDDLVITQGPSHPGTVPTGPPQPHRSVDVAQRNAEDRDLGLRTASHEYDEILDRHYSALCGFRGELAGGSLDEWTTRLAGAIPGASGSLDGQRHRAGDRWEQVQRLVLYAVTTEHWTEVLETMSHVRDWVNLVALGGDYPITEWRRRSDEAVAEMMTLLDKDYIERLLTVSIIRGPAPVWIADEPTQEIEAAVPADKAQLPRPALHPTKYQPRLILDWAEGFAGPGFQEVVVVVDPSGGELGDATLSHDGMTVYLN